MNEILGGIYTQVSPNFQRGLLPKLSRTIKAYTHDASVIMRERGGYDMTENEKFRIRKLTPNECFRLMGFSDEDFLAAKIGDRNKARELLKKYPDRGLEMMNEADKMTMTSNSQLYKMAGNSIVVDVLYYIYLELYKAMPYLFDDLKVGSFFSGIGAFEKGLDRLYGTISNCNY